MFIVQHHYLPYRLLIFWFQLSYSERVHMLRIIYVRRKREMAYNIQHQNTAFKYKDSYMNHDKLIFTHYFKNQY